ncbi:MAG TPA: peptidylprolyl isomerase [Gammaproteobacteria bacterium]|nr:peptidylprolyl isomerase [Gammaproteobacteria bacterium]
MVSKIPGKSEFAVFLLALLTFCHSQSVMAFSIREFLGLDKPETEQKVDPADTKPAMKPAGNVKKSPEPVFEYKLDYDELQQIVSVLNPDQRKVVLSDQEAFKNFINNEARNKSLLAAAHANKIDQNERNLYIAKRGAENVIREIYLNQLIASKIPADYPTEEQMKEFYEKNRDNFILPERVPVWQIFLAIQEGAGKKDIELQKKQAESIISDIKKGKLDFTDAARQYSAQGAGKLRGGYLGLIDVTELKPDIQQPLLALKPNTLSNPITTEKGVHILKRGNIIGKQQLAYSDVKDQIKKSLNRRLRNQIRQAVFKQAAEVYPSGITDKNLEEWRLKLRTQRTVDADTVSSE